jgi:cytochrome c-type biogenesis protein
MVCMEFLTNLLENSTMPWLSALVLGLMTAISPCPLATNITAIGFISRDIENRNRVFVNGLMYTLGRAISYTVLALIIYFGADQLKFSGFFQLYGGKIIGPVLIIIGLLMLDLLKISFPGMSRITSKMESKTKWSYADAVILGVVFALAFCPYSGVLYFGMLIPMTISSASGLYLPIVFALATGIPVVLFAWLLAFSVSSLGKVYHKLKIFERWFRRVIALLFILVGVYYCFKIFV